MLHEYRTRCRKEIEELKALFRCIDLDESGSLSLDEWEESLESEVVQTLLASMDLGVKDSSEFFRQILDLSSTNTVDIDAFVDGCVVMRSGNLSVDVHLLTCETKTMHKSLDDILGLLSRIAVGLTSKS